MTQRSANNDRYTQEKRTGVSRKSASSAKPKSKAHSSVTMGSGKKAGKTKEQQKADKKAEKARQRELERKYYTPPTESFKRLKRLWWGCLAGAVVCLVISWFGRSYLPEQASLVVLIMSYACIIGALYLDLGKMRKARREYAAQMEAPKTKQARAAERDEKRRAREAEKKAAEQKDAAAEAPEPAPEPTGLAKVFAGFGKGKAKKAAAKGDGTAADGAADGAASAAGAAADDAKGGK